jgi:hypothetical protein
MLPTEALATLRHLLSCQALGAPTGNLTLAKGINAGQSVLVAVVEPRFASGALGVAECDKLAGVFKVATATRQPLILYLDSAGAKVSEGLPALGAFRRMFASALAAVQADVPMTAICGTNCFGGASMLASLASLRLFCDNSRFAMSGPAILAQSAGLDATDDMFQAMAVAAIGAQARVKVGEGNCRFDVARLQQRPLPTTIAQRHDALADRAAPLSKSQSHAEPLRRRDLEKLYPHGYSLVIEGNAVRGTAQYEGEAIAVLGWVGSTPMGADGAIKLSRWALDLSAEPPRRLHVLVECDAHAASLEDERVVLSAYLAHLAVALHTLAARGVSIKTIVLSKLGGGVYVALAAPSANVTLLYEAEIQLLPGRAIASILGDSSAQKFTVKDYLDAGVAEAELKLGVL